MAALNGKIVKDGEGENIKRITVLLIVHAVDDGNFIQKTNVPRSWSGTPENENMCAREVQESKGPARTFESV